MAKKKQHKELEKKRRIKKGENRTIRASKPKKLTAKQKSEIEKLINAPRLTHHKREKLAYDEFHDLEFQRLAMSDELKKTLISHTINEYSFENWVRCVSYQFANSPLSSRGSVHSIGGRFNIGQDINEGGVTPFNALYIAENQQTALMEKFGVSKEADLGKVMEACFEKKENSVSVHVSGKLHHVLDIEDNSSLKEFVQLISRVKKSTEIQNRRKFLGLTAGEVIRDVKSLRKSLYEPEWRFEPQIYDLPANSQIFGQLAYRAGVEAILYQSVKGQKKCLAIFPKNLCDKSYVEIRGKYPDTVKVSKLDSENYHKTL